jgi:hypothetical protein
MKRHSYELVGIHDNIDAVLKNLARWFRRRRPKFEDDVVEKTPNTYEELAPGNRYGRYNEVIRRRELRRRGTPDWFDPQNVPGQFGIIGPDGVRCYIEVELNWELRDKPSTFDLQIASLVEPRAEQISLF